jgi:hypothetical protein
MKTALILATIAGAFAFAAPAQAGGRVNVYVGGGGGYYGGGCGPRYYAPRVYCAPRPVYYRAPRVAYYRPAPVYRAPIVNVGVRIGPAFGWRRW